MPRQLTSGTAERLYLEQVKVKFHSFHVKVLEKFIGNHSMSFVLYSSFSAAYRSRFTYSHSRGGTETPKQPLRDFDCIINECIVYKSGWNVIILLLVERCIFWLLAGQKLYHHQSCDITYRKHD